MATRVVSPLPIHRIDVETYNHMVDAGTLEGRPVELVEGLLIDKWAPEVSGALPIYRLDADTYNGIVESGALEGKPVELVGGLILDISPHSPRHAAVIARLSRHLAAARGWLQVQLPIEVSSDSVPEPDLSLIEQEPPPNRHPRTALLVVEVAVTSHSLDRGSKAARYARAGIGTYWLVDVPAKTVEVHTEPGPDGYGRCDVFREGSTVPSPATGVVDLDVAVLLAGIEA